VRRRDNDENCLVIWTWRDWLWLDPVDYSDAAPFSDRIYDYELVGRTQPAQVSRSCGVKA
jgi:hypothetical protein